MQFRLEDIEELRVCDVCGVVYEYLQNVISENKRDWYGTDVTTHCPNCKHEETFNLGDGYYK